ncbi:hypothetical protein OAC17_00505 [Flavobacteriaceae bacterium]|nr:hypothetical protein [Flavobacteriaceae bacterium]
MREIRKKKRRIGGWELRHERSDWLSEVRQLGIRTRAKSFRQAQRPSGHRACRGVEVSRCRDEAI